MTVTPQWGLIFDMDGVLLDSECIIRDELRAAAAQLGWAIPMDVYQQLIGRKSQDVEALLRQHLGAEFPFADVRAQAKERVQQRIVDGWPLKGGVVSLLSRLHDAQLPCAVATSTARAEAERRLQSAGIDHYFAAICGGDEVEEGKPAPDLFLLAAARLERQPASCVVFEDSPYGLQGSDAAGMRGIWVPDLVAPQSGGGERWQIVESLDHVVVMLESGELFDPAPGGSSGL